MTDLSGYVRMSVDDRREAVKELTADGQSQREVAEILGVSHTTVQRDMSPGTNVPEHAHNQVNFGTDVPSGSTNAEPSDALAEKRAAKEAAREERRNTPERFPTYDELVSIIPADAPWFTMTEAERRAIMERSTDEELRKRAFDHLSDAELLAIIRPDGSDLTDAELQTIAEAAP